MSHECCDKDGIGVTYSEDCKGNSSTVQLIIFARYIPPVSATKSER